jgi:hypothetical protein
MITRTFSRERDTKNTVMFREEGTETAVGQLYLQKAVLQQLGNPETIAVVIGRPDEFSS